MRRASLTFLVLCVSAMVLGAYMAIAPTEGRPDYVAALLQPVPWLAAAG